MRVLTRRAVLLPTPPEGGDREAIAFKTRQLQIVHVYVPSLWVWLGVALHAEALALPLALLGVAGRCGWRSASWRRSRRWACCARRCMTG